MERILIAVCGSNDPNPKNDLNLVKDETQDGPILTTIGAVYPLFNRLIVISLGGQRADISFDNRAANVVKIARHRMPQLETELHNLNLEAPHELNDVYSGLVKFLCNRFEQIAFKDVELTVDISPGVPAVQTVWVLIKASGALPIRLIRSLRRGEEKNGKRYSNVIVDKTKLDYNYLETNLRSSFSEQVQMLADAHPINLFRRDIREAGIITENDVLIKQLEKVIHAARGLRHVLITGETGTGKELAAGLYANAILGRSRKNYIAVNCAQFEKKTVASELFGHKRGAFTGAVSEKTGLIRSADKGVLFLDEIGELPMEVQATLLRTIEEQTVRPLGADRSIPINVRFIAATNRNIEEGIAKQTFREDLNYRFHVRVHLPPLRKRTEDIDLLVKHFLKRRSGRDDLTFSPKALQRLRDYPYYGNVRELMNKIDEMLAARQPEDTVIPVQLVNHVLPGGQRVVNSSADLFTISDDLPQILPMITPSDGQSKWDYIVSVFKHHLATALADTHPTCWHGGKPSPKKLGDLVGISDKAMRQNLKGENLLSGDRKKSD